MWCLMIDVVIKFVEIAIGGVLSLATVGMIPIEDKYIDIANIGIGLAGAMISKHMNWPSDVAILFLGYGAVSGVDLLAKTVGV